MQIKCANGESLKFVGGDITQSRVRLVRVVVVPGTKARFVVAALDLPLIEGEEVVFEPDVQSLNS